MKILVPIKRVIDFNVRVQLKRDGSGVQTDGVKMSINPFDEIAVEEALRIRERCEADEIVVISIGGAEVQQQLRTALAMGADRAIHINTSEEVQPLHAARALLAVQEREHAQLILMGKQAIDDDNNQTGQMLAALWGRPQATFTSRLTFNNGSATAVREVDAGLETIEIELPAVVTTDLRLNEPRFVKMPDIMKAKKKPLDTIALDELGVDKPARLEILEYAPPPQRSGGHKVESVEQLIAELKNKGVL